MLLYNQYYMSIGSILDISVKSLGINRSEKNCLGEVKRTKDGVRVKLPLLAHLLIPLFNEVYFFNMSCNLSITLRLNFLIFSMI